MVDKSGSIFLNEDKLFDAIKENISQLNKNDIAGVVEFGRFADIDYPVVKRNNALKLLTPPRREKESNIQRDVTNIEKAILFAKGLFPSDYSKEIFLFSDGNETEGDAKAVVPLVKQRNITLYTIPIGPKEVQDIKIEHLDAPKFVREGQPIELKCRIASTVNTTANLQVYRDWRLIRELKEVPSLVRELKGVSLLKGQDNSVIVTLPAQSEPVMTYEVTVSVKELNEITMRNNHWKVVVQKVGKPKIAYVSEAANPSQRTIYSIIKSTNDFDIQIIKLPTYIDNCDDIIITYIGVIPFDKLYDVIILDDVSLVREGSYENIQSSMKTFVSNGGGLLVVGGQDSFGLGNYQNSEIEKILPVYASPPEDLSVIMILDASGSMDEFPDEMAGNTKFRQASKALWDSVSLLSKIDRLEVMVFNQGYETILPFQNADNVVPKLIESIIKVKPTGPTAIIPPLRKAIKTLSNVSSAKKHIILLSDGYSTTNEPLDEFHKVSDKLKENNITLSAVATGVRINEETLKALTGKVYKLSGQKQIEQITDNLKNDLSIQKEFYREADNLPVSVHNKEDILKGIDSIPPISGYNRTTLKADARLVASVSKDNDPLIADWQYGLGKVMVLNTSLDSKWMGGWERWGSLAQLVTQGLRYIMPLSSKENTPTKIKTEQLPDGTIKLTIDIPTDSLNLFAQIVGAIHELPLQTTPVRIPQVAVGKYEAILNTNNKEDFIISVFSDKDNIRQLISKIPVVKQYPKEWRKFTPDTVFLRNLAEPTGGSLITADSFMNEQPPLPLWKGGLRGLFNPPDTSKTYHRMNTILIILVLVLFITDLVVSLYRR